MRPRAVAAELVGTFTIAAVFMGRIPARLTGAIIGATLVVGIAWAGHGSNGVLNPAVALGIGSFSLPYVWGPTARARTISSRAGRSPARS